MRLATFLSVTVRRLPARTMSGSGTRTVYRVAGRLLPGLLLLALLLLGPPAFAQLASNAPADQPKNLQARQAEKLDLAIAPLVKIARESYPAARDRFLLGLPKGESMFVTTRLRDPNGKWEQSFVRVQSIAGARITGVIASRLQLVTSFRQGQAYSLDDSELIDWLITKPDGSEEGNYVGKFLDTYTP